MTSRAFRGKLPYKPAFFSLNAGWRNDNVPAPMSRSEFHPDDSLIDPTHTLEEHFRAGFPPDLALDLVLNEIVVRASQATRASAAALALIRGDQMVCRAATGALAPDLGVPLNTRDGLSGACLETRQPQLSVDTEFDPRVDPAISRRLGIRSILIVPVLDGSGKNAQFAGVLEVFSTSPAAFSHNDQKVLEDFAEECARVRQAAIEIGRRKPSTGIGAVEMLPPVVGGILTPLVRRPGYERWTLFLGGLAILTTVAVSFLIGYRIGWLRQWFTPPQVASNVAPNVGPVYSSSIPPDPTRANALKSQGAGSASATAKQNSAPAADELVVYEKGKVIFRMKPATGRDAPSHAPPMSKTNQPDSNPIVEASATTKISPKVDAVKTALQSVWLSPVQAESRILSRTEPHYPSAALAAHRAGNVVLEVQIAEDGSVSKIRTLSGDPLLATAATEAVRNWRYKPYYEHNRATRFQTDVTLSFSLPN